jgi:hypothetical protein
MAYELHITRADDWTESEDDPIDRAEWEEAAAADQRLVEAGEVNWTDLGNIAVFTWRDENGPSFLWRDGQINVKGVRGEAEIGEIARFAQTLGAVLMGDDGETYDESGSPS